MEDVFKMKSVYVIRYLYESRSHYLDYIRSVTLVCVGLYDKFAGINTSC
jgi:hypothetical protein